MEVQRLFVVAGPNGSGKSLFSGVLTITEYEVFDGDKYMTELTKKYPETGSEALWSYINQEIFEEQKQRAIRERKNYAFETNFSSADPMKSVHEFRRAGYKIDLIFMGLNSLEESFQRVAYRVRNGGHLVSEASIRYNYEYGLKNLYKCYRDFDSVTLFDNGIAQSKTVIEPREILSIVNGELTFSSGYCPEWAKPVLEGFNKH